MRAINLFRLNFVTYLGTGVLLLCLPLIGIALKGEKYRKYLEFPPLTRYVAHPGFSLSAFAFLSLLFLLTAFLLHRAILTGHKNASPRTRSAVSHFPWWGWIGLLILSAGWVIAWNRFAFIGKLQFHTFLPLWLGYILSVNALCVKRNGRSLLTDAPWRFILLFPASAVFWWFFEYLNRFVQNWYYLNVDHFTRVQYITFATLSFSTVLPAVLSTTALLLTFPAFGRGMKNLPSLRIPAPRPFASIVLLISVVGLSMIGVLPNLLFPLLWLSPLLIFVSIQTLGNKKTVLSSISRGDWRMVLASATAALICGFFWELWNVNSLAKWEYAIPYVNCWRIFEMPVLGYLGYLPFGLECIVVGIAVVDLDMQEKWGRF